MIQELILILWIKIKIPPFQVACLLENYDVINLFLSSNRRINIHKPISKVYNYLSGTTCLDILKNKHINIENIQKK